MPANFRDQLRAFRKRLQAVAVENGVEVRISGDTNERLLVELDSRAFIVLLPMSHLLLTPGRVAKRIANWPGFQGRRAAGHVILAAYAELSPVVMNSREGNLPPKVAAVGLWGTKNQLAASQIDSDMALILVAAGVPTERISGALANSSAPPSTDNTVTSETRQASGRSLRPGQRLDYYLLERRLGRGHSAEVWKAKLTTQIPGIDLASGSDVALKIYFPSMLQGFQTLRIQREFAVAAELRHPNLARVFDLVLSPSRPFHTFMAMEYIDGPSLRSFIESNGKLSAEQTIAIAEQLFSALQEIHSEEALHRDVKAANIMVISGRRPALAVKLVDLGIVSIPSEDRFTAVSVFLGSKHSAPLEQLVGGQIDERTDIYGAGSVLYQCLRGEPMYNNAGPEGAIVLRMRDKPEALSSTSGEGSLEDALVGFINKCIPPAPVMRPSSAAECLRQLARLRS